jgi:L-ascorbate metabolism protein UlaG (beta-lactamase superfamily)
MIAEDRVDGVADAKQERMRAMTGDPKGLTRLRTLLLERWQTALWWLGQASFAVQGRDTTILIDPFLSDDPDRQFPPAFPPAQASGVDLILITHEHMDHLDQPSIAALAGASPEARFVVPRPLVETMYSLGVAPRQVIGVQPGEPVNLAGVTVHPVPAMHGIHTTDAYSFGQETSGGLTRFLGYVVNVGTVHIYHAGDTIHYDGMEAWLRPLDVDVALLPINGRDEKREAEDLVGNLDHAEAARLASDIGADLLVPMHYDMFEGNPGYPEKVVEVAREQHPDLSVLLLSRNKLFIYTKP